MDEAAQAKYAEDLAKAGPVGGRGGLGLDANAAPQAKRKVSKAEKELLGSMKGRAGGLSSMQTTVARAITHGNANFDPWKKPVKTSELNNVNVSKTGLYSHFQSAGLIEGSSTRPEDDVPKIDLKKEEVQTQVKKALKAGGGGVKRKALRKSAVEALLASTGLGVGCEAAMQVLVDAAIERGSRKGKWSLSDTGVVSRSKKRKL
jgi:hypothetical protein